MGCLWRCSYDTWGPSWYSPWPLGLFQWTSATLSPLTHELVSGSIRSIQGLRRPELAIVHLINQPTNFMGIGLIQLLHHVQQLSSTRVCYCNHAVAEKNLLRFVSIRDCTFAMIVCFASFISNPEQFTPVKSGTDSRARFRFSFCQWLCTFCRPEPCPHAWHTLFRKTSRNSPWSFLARSRRSPKYSFHWLRSSHSWSRLPKTQPGGSPGWEPRMGIGRPW